MGESAKKGTMKHPSRKQAQKIENHLKFKQGYIINLNSTIYIDIPAVKSHLIRFSFIFLMQMIFSDF